MAMMMMMTTKVDFDGMDANPASTEADNHDGEDQGSHSHDGGYIIPPESMSSQFTPDNNMIDHSKYGEHNIIMSANNNSFPPPPPPHYSSSNSKKSYRVDYKNHPASAASSSSSSSSSPVAALQPLHHQHQQLQRPSSIRQQQPRGESLPYYFHHPNHSHPGIDDAPSYSCDYSSQYAASDQQYTASVRSSESSSSSSSSSASESLDGCEISLSSAAGYDASATTHPILVGANSSSSSSSSSSNNVLVILQENEHNKGSSANGDSLRVVTATKIMSENKSKNKRMMMMDRKRGSVSSKGGSGSSSSSKQISGTGNSDDIDNNSSSPGTGTGNTNTNTNTTSRASRWKQKMSRKRSSARNNKKTTTSTTSTTGTSTANNGTVSREDANSTPQMSNSRKEFADIDNSALDNIATPAATNLFLRMVDEEVGNDDGLTYVVAKPEDNDDDDLGISRDLSYDSKHTGSTAPTAVMTIDNGGTAAAATVVDIDGTSALGSAAAGLRFHPAMGNNSASSGGGSFGNNDATSSLADDTDDVEEDEEKEEYEYYPSPIKKKSGAPKPSSKEKKSPSSVMEGIGLGAGVTSFGSSQRQTSLTSFPRYHKTNENNRNGRVVKGSSSGAFGHGHDSSFDESEFSLDEEGTVAADPYYGYDDHSTVASASKSRRSRGSRGGNRSRGTTTNRNKKKGGNSIGNNSSSNYGNNYSTSSGYGSGAETTEAGASASTGYYRTSNNAPNMRDVRSLQKALFKQVSEPLDKFHDFITGSNMCFSGKNALIGRMQEGCADALDDEDSDYDEEEDTMAGEETEEEDGRDTEDDYSIEVSLFATESEGRSLAEVSRASSSRYHQARLAKGKKRQQQQQQPKKKNQTKSKKPMKEEHHPTKRQQQQQPPSSQLAQAAKKSSSRSRSAHRRGRSPTEKHGYNSDGESLTRSNSRRRRRGNGGGNGNNSGTMSVSGRGSPCGTSLSLSSRNSSGGEREEVVITGTKAIANRHHHQKNHNHHPMGQQQQQQQGIVMEQQQHTNNEDHSSVAAESIVESVLSHDQASWMAMTAQPFTAPQQQQSSSHDGGLANVSKNVVGADASLPGGSERVARCDVDARDEVDELDSFFCEDLLLTEGANEECAEDINSSPFDMSDFGAIDGYFKKLLSVGIQLLLNDPPPTTPHNSGNNSVTSYPRLNRMGKMFLKFGTRSLSTGKYEHPYLLWTDGDSISYALELLDVQSIRQPTSYELESNYPFAIPAYSFFVSTMKPNVNEDPENAVDNGVELLFEAVDALQMERVTTALRGIVSRLAKKIIMGDTDWMVQMMLSSSSSSSAGKELQQNGPQQHQLSMEELDLEGSAVPNAISDVTDHLVKKTTLMQQAQARRSRMRYHRR